MAAPSLETEGVIERRRAPRRRGRTYHLTESGQEFAPLVEALGVWGQRWSRRELAKHEVNLGLLIWALERSVRPAAFGAARTVVRIEFPEQPRSKRLWWFVNEAAGVDLCLNEPGYEVELYLCCSLRAMIQIVRGDVTLASAIARGALDVHGSSCARAALEAWLDLSPLAKVGPTRQDRAAH